MSIGNGNIMFLTTLLIIGLSNHFVECLLEHAQSDVENMKYGMQIFKNYENILEKYGKKSSSADWLDILLEEIVEIKHVTVNLNIELESIMATSNALQEDYQIHGKRYAKNEIAQLWVVKFVALENCSIFLQACAHYNQKNDRKTAKKFAKITVYLAAFAIDPYTNTLTYNGIRNKLFRTVSLGKSYEPENMKNIPYEEFVDKIRNIIVSHYNVENNELDISSSYLEDDFKVLNSYANTINSVLKSILFAIEPHIPGISAVTDYDKTKLWQSISKKEDKEVSDLIETINSSVDQRVSGILGTPGLGWGKMFANAWKTIFRGRAGGSSDKSMLLELLHKIEILKIRLYRPEMADEIEEIANGFSDDEKFEVLPSFVTSYLAPFIVFVKRIGSDNSEKILANGTTYKDFLDEHGAIVEHARNRLP